MADNNKEYPYSPKEFFQELIDQVVGWVNGFAFKISDAVKTISDKSTDEEIPTAKAVNGVVTDIKSSIPKTINNTNLNGRENIRLTDSYNISLNTNKANPTYCIFAKMPLSNPEYNMGATIIATDFGFMIGKYYGAWLIQLNNRGSVPSMEVTVLRKNDTGDVIFGYYTDSSYIYFGVYTSKWRSDSNITVLRNSQVIFEKIYDDTMKPDGWVEATVRTLLSDDVTETKK